MGVSEVRWPNPRDFRTDDYRFIYTGTDNGYTGVGVMLNKKWGNKIQSYFQYTDRIIMVKINTQSNNNDYHASIHVYNHS